MKTPMSKIAAVQKECYGENADNYISGCLVGGAIGDALGYAVEFDSYEDIIARFGNKGIEDYVLESGLAVISDDTQMTLFTAEGLLYAHKKNGEISVEEYVYEFYLKWFSTQGFVPPNSKNEVVSKLVEIPRLNIKRAPGNTCLSALNGGRMGTIENNLNSSKGCGTVMRVAPVGAMYTSRSDAFVIGAKIGALTHGHPLGYLASGLLAEIISKLIHEDEKDLEKVVRFSLEHLEEMRTVIDCYQGCYDELKEIMLKAIELSHQDIVPLDAIKILGGGWVAEEALAISVYCALKTNCDFKKAIVLAVNHDGDSDSTGAITGNIVGAIVGYDKLPKQYLEHLELKDVILAIAEELAYIRK